jgi:hypothetical protein
MRPLALSVVLALDRTLTGDLVKDAMK